MTVRFDWKQVRVFISSTFLDMQAERDHLVRFVFPRLRTTLFPKRIHLLDVDLRWGVTGERDASEVCREVISLCRPRFLCILGGRFGSLPPGKTRSITADEIYFAVLDRRGEDHHFSYFYFRHDDATRAMEETRSGEFREPPGSDNFSKLQNLKNEIAAARLRRFTYEPQWDAKTKRLIHLEQFGSRVYTDLLEGMQHDPDLQDRFGTNSTQFLDEFQEEEAAIDAFVGEQTDSFVLGTRDRILQGLLDHANAVGGKSYACVVGAPGIGKTALLAYLSREAALGSGDAIFIRHFVGASPVSTDPQRVLRRFCQDLKIGCPELTGEIPEDAEERRTAFRGFLHAACARRRVVILLDGIDQFRLESDSSALRWLPEQPPENARFILSAAPGPELDALRQYLSPREIPLDLLSAADREAILHRFHELYGKGLERTQQDALLKKADAGSPLYLRTALEELRTLGSREEIPGRVAELPPSTNGLFGWILKRLEQDDGFRDVADAKIGQDLVPRFAALLAASRQGLSQAELIGLLAPEDPGGNVAALMRLLRPYLIWRGELVDFYHRRFREAVRAEYLDRDRDAHRTLAVHFRRLADPLGTNTWSGSVPRAFGELPYHLHSAQSYGELVNALTSRSYAERVVAVLSREVLFDNLEFGLRAARSESSVFYAARMLCAWGHAENAGISESRFSELADQGRVADAARAARARPPAEAARLLIRGVCRALDRGWRVDSEKWLQVIGNSSQIIAHANLREHLRLVERLVALDEPAGLDTLLVGRPRESATRILCFLIGTRQLSAATYPRLIEVTSRIPDPLWRAFVLLVICLRGLHERMPAVDVAIRRLREDAAGIRGSGRHTVLIEAISRGYRWLATAGIEPLDLGLSPEDVDGMVNSVPPVLTRDLGGGSVTFLGADTEFIRDLDRMLLARRNAPAPAGDPNRTVLGSFAFLQAETEQDEDAGADDVSWVVYRTVARLVDGSTIHPDQFAPCLELARELLAERTNAGGDVESIFLLSLLPASEDGAARCAEVEPFLDGFLRLSEDARTVVAGSLLRLGQLQLLTDVLDIQCSRVGADCVLPEVFRLIRECRARPGVQDWLQRALEMMRIETNRPGRVQRTFHDDPLAPAAAQVVELMAEFGRVDEARRWISWLLTQLNPPVTVLPLGGEAGRSAKTNVLLSAILPALPSPRPLDSDGPTAEEVARLAIRISPALREAVCQEYQSPYPPLDYLGARIAAWKAEDSAWTAASSPQAMEIFRQNVRPGAIYDDYERQRSWFLWLLCLARDPSEQDLAACRSHLFGHSGPIFPHESAVCKPLGIESGNGSNDPSLARIVSVLLGHVREPQDFPMTDRLAAAAIDCFWEPAEQAEVMALAAAAAARQDCSEKAQVYVMTAGAISPGFQEQAQRRVDLIQATKAADFAVLAQFAGRGGFEDALRESVAMRTAAQDSVGLLGLTRFLADCPGIWRDLLLALGTLYCRAPDAAALVTALMAESEPYVRRREPEGRTNA